MIYSNSFQQETPDLQVSLQCCSGYITKQQNDVCKMLSQVHSEEKQRNGRMLKNVMQNIQFLGRQGIVLRGHHEAEINFIQLKKLRCHDQKVRRLIKLYIILLYVYSLE